MKMKRGEKEGRIAFAARVVNAVAGAVENPPQPVDELYAVIDKRCKRTKTTKVRFATNLSDAARKYELISVRKNKGLWRKLKANAPLFYPLDGDGLSCDEEATVQKEATTEKVVKTVSVSNESIDGCSAGQLLKFAYGMDKDDVMSVVEDLLYDRPIANTRLALKSVLDYLSSRNGEYLLDALDSAMQV